jgi:hypothetical protein
VQVIFPERLNAFPDYGIININLTSFNVFLLNNTKMKKILALFPVLLLCLFAHSQVLKNSVLLGGQLSYNSGTTTFSNNQPDFKNKGATFQVSAGKAFKDNQVLGINLSFNPSTTNGLYNGSEYYKVKMNYYSGGVYYRNYRQLAKDFYFFAEMSASYFGSSQNNTDASGKQILKSNQSGGMVALAPGISYRLFKKMFLEISIPNIVSAQYSTTKTTNENVESKQNQFSVYSSLNTGNLGYLGVGFRFIL